MQAYGSGLTAAFWPASALTTVNSMEPRTDEEIHDSPAGWVARHIGEYVATDGEKGHPLARDQHTPVDHPGPQDRKVETHRPHIRQGPRRLRGGRASKGGAPDHPAWYYNLVDEPRVVIQVGADVMEGTARTVSGDQRARLWSQMASIWPDYNDYQQKTDREIPVVVIEST